MNGVTLGIDPGMKKCGFALIAEPGAPPLELGIVPTESLPDRIRELSERCQIRAIALGGGTHTAAVASLLAGLGLPLRVVDERETSLLARRRYFETYPPRGWRRFIPRGMLLPPRPVDDFAALLIAERLLAVERAEAEPTEKNASADA